jgi:hypothetical protein
MKDKTLSPPYTVLQLNWAHLDRMEAGSRRMFRLTLTVGLAHVPVGCMSFFHPLRPLGGYQPKWLCDPQPCRSLLPTPPLLRWGLCSAVNRFLLHSGRCGFWILTVE